MSGSVEASRLVARSPIRFRNVQVDGSAPLAEWPAEAIATVVDRGGLAEWRALATEIRRSPWGRVARIVEEVCERGEQPGVDRLLSRAIAQARDMVAATARRREADRLRRLRLDTGLSLAAFASLAGTSASRLSDYENAKVAPTTDTVGRLEHAARVALSDVGSAHERGPV